MKKFEVTYRYNKLRKGRVVGTKLTDGKRTVSAHDAEHAIALVKRSARGYFDTVRVVELQ